MTLTPDTTLGIAGAGRGKRARELTAADVERLNAAEAKRARKAAKRLRAGQ